MTFPYIIAGVVVLHFIIGIVYLIYKISSAKPTDKSHVTDIEEK